MKCERYLILPVLLLFTPLFADEQTSRKQLDLARETIRLRYLKAGTELGIGYREHKNLHGFDLSLSEAICFYPNWINVKGLYVQYPYHSSRHFFYWGVGAGINYEFNYHSESGSTPLMPYIGCPNCHHWRVFPSLEGVVGYEFFADKNVKMFVQGSLSVPVGDASLPFVPALSIGVGF